MNKAAAGKDVELLSHTEPAAFDMITQLSNLYKKR